MSLLPPAPSPPTPSPRPLVQQGTEWRATWGPECGSTRHRPVSLGFAQGICTSRSFSPAPPGEARRSDPATKEETLSLQLPLGASRFLFSVPLLVLLPPSGAPSPPSPSFKPQMEGPAPGEGEALALITCADGALSARGCDAMRCVWHPPAQTPLPAAAWPPSPSTHWRWRLRAQVSLIPLLIHSFTHSFVQQT